MHLLAISSGPRPPELLMIRWWGVGGAEMKALGLKVSGSTQTAWGQAALDQGSAGVNLGYLGQPGSRGINLDGPEMKSTGIRVPGLIQKTHGSRQNWMKGIKAVPPPPDALKTHKSGAPLQPPTTSSGLSALHCFFKQVAGASRHSFIFTFPSCFQAPYTTKQHEGSKKQSLLEKKLS